jgi:hypothetical protein
MNTADVPGGKPIVETLPINIKIGNTQCNIQERKIKDHKLEKNLRAILFETININNYNNDEKNLKATFPLPVRLGYALSSTKYLVSHNQNS